MQAGIDSQIVFLTTVDLARTAEFYEQVLGLRLVLDQGRCRIYQVAAGANIGFCERERVPQTDCVIITMVTEDVDAFAEKLKSKGVVFEKEPEHNPDYNIYHCFLRDPNGYKLEIQRFEDPRWPPQP